MFCKAPLDRLMISLMEEKEVEAASIAWNLYHDHRISAERFASFSRRAGEMGDVTDVQSLQTAISHYQAKEVQQTVDPEFLHAPENGCNFHCPGRLTPLHGDLQLVRILNLNRLGRIYADARARSVPGFLDYQEIITELSGLRRPSTTLEWLDKRLAPLRDRSSALPQSDPFLASLLAYMADYRKGFPGERPNPYEPAWVTLWRDFAARGGADQIDRWQPLVGVPPDAGEPSWLLLLRYTVREAGPMIRPTQLDAGWFPAHFPSPPAAPHGHPMDLHGGAPRHDQLPEYIHQQIDHVPAHILDCARVEPADLSLEASQRCHYEGLEGRYGGLQDWVARKHPAYR